MKGELKCTAIPTPISFYFTNFSHKKERERGYGAQRWIKCRGCYGNRAKREEQRYLMKKRRKKKLCCSVALSRFYHMVNRKRVLQNLKLRINIICIFSSYYFLFVPCWLKLINNK